MANSPQVSHPSPFGAATTTLRPERTHALRPWTYRLRPVPHRRSHSFRRQLTYVGTERHPRKDKMSAFVVWSPFWLMKPPCCVTALR